MQIVEIEMSNRGTSKQQRITRRIDYSIGGCCKLVVPVRVPVPYELTPRRTSERFRSKTYYRTVHYSSLRPEI